MAATRSRELFTLTVLVLALGIAVGSAKLFGVSMALGAFLAGMVVGRSEFSLRAATEALPMRGRVRRPLLRLGRHALQPASPDRVPGPRGRDVGGRPRSASRSPPSPSSCFLKYPLRVAVSVAVATAQIGEFSFILAAAGKTLGLLDDRATNTLIAAAIISITLNPLLYRLVGPLEDCLRRFVKDPGPVGPRDAPGAADGQAVAGSAERYRAIIIGYGPVGRTVSRLLRENQIEPVVDRAQHGDRTPARQRKGSEPSTATRPIARPWSKPGSGTAVGPHPEFVEHARQRRRRSGMARELNPKILIIRPLESTSARIGHSATRGPTSSSRAKARSPWR